MQQFIPDFLMCQHTLEIKFLAHQTWKSIIWSLNSATVCTVTVPVPSLEKGGGW